LLDLASSDGPPDPNRSSRTRLAVAGLAATVLPSLVLVGIAARGTTRGEPVAAAAAPAEVVSVTTTVDRLTTLPPTTATITVPPPAPPPPPPPPPRAPPVTAPVTAPPTTRPKPATTAPATVVVVGTGAGASQAELDFLACTRRIESTNNYHAVDPSGTYYGAY